MHRCLSSCTLSLSHGLIRDYWRRVSTPFSSRYIGRQPTCRALGNMLGGIIGNSNPFPIGQLQDLRVGTMIRIRYELGEFLFDPCIVNKLKNVRTGTLVDI